MTEFLRSPVFRYGAVISALVLAAAFLLPGVRIGGFSPSNFLPHATCYLQEPRLIFLHATSDSLIGLSYLSISATLGFLVYRARQDIPFHWMFMAFGLFIVACGFTHIIAVITVWHPIYWLSADVKIVTAVASIGTAVALPLLLPKVFSLIHSAKMSEQRKLDLESANAELKELYQKVKELDDLKSQFFANVSHELRTPLALILGPAEKLASSGTLHPEQFQHVETIRRSSALLLGHVNNLLEASRLEAGRVPMDYRAIDLAALFRLTASHFRTVGDDRKISFEIEAPESLSAEVDPEKIQRVLLNLFSNAFKFVPSGGRIRCALETTDDRARFLVQDNGPGISRSMREAVFERFRQVEGGSTRRFGGTGLGLSIAKDIAELHGGTIQVEETPGGGATFIVDIPRKAPPGVEVKPEEKREGVALGDVHQLGLDSAAAPPAETAERTGRPLVLVIEDDPQMNRFVSGILAETYDVISAHNGAEGLQKAIQNEPALILSDIMMPEMSGDQLVPRLRETDALAETPIILLSAKADEELRIRLLREGASDYMLKPFSVEEVRAKAANFIAWSQARRALQDELDSREGDLAKLVSDTIWRKKQLEKALADQRRAEDGLRRLNSELEQRVAHRTEALARTNEELKLFTSTATHDLRSPLRTISGMADILLEDHATELSPDAQDLLARIRASVRRMDTLIQDLFAYSRVGQTEVDLQPLPLGQVIKDGYDALQEELRSRNAEVEIETTDLRVVGQETLLTQTVINLLSNAAKYVAPGTRPRVRVSVEERGDRVRLLVSDNGVGIAPEDQDKIFELFTRLHPARDYPGSGLGLAIVAKAVKRMGGSFGVESGPGSGSTFWVELRKAGD